MQLPLRLVLFLWLLPGGVMAQGMFDFLDPCIGAKQAYWREHGSLVENLNFQAEAVNSALPTDRFRGWWWGEKRAILVPYYEREIWPILARAGATSKEAAFNVWMDKQVREAGGPAKMEELMTAEFRRLRSLVLAKQRGETLAVLDQQRRQLYGSCPQDVANQVFRGMQVVVSAPVGVISRNIEISRRESGEIAKGVAVTTGVSIRDIESRGPLGGDNSEARKVCNGIARAFGGRC